MYVSQPEDLRVPNLPPTDFFFRWGDRAFVKGLSSHQGDPLEHLKFDHIDPIGQKSNVANIIERDA